MKRKFYFFLEQLEIKRSERITVTVLMSFIIILSGIYYYHEPAENYDQDHYENLERIFKEKSQQLEQEKQDILARYQPSIVIPATRNQPVLDDISAIETDRAIDPSKNRVLINETVVKTEAIKILDIININTASEEQLVTLPGIGPAYARRIIEWREENGLFTEKSQLLDIRGIGERRLEQLTPFIEL